MIIDTIVWLYSPHTIDFMDYSIQYGVRTGSRLDVESREISSASAVRYIIIPLRRVTAARQSILNQVIKNPSTKEENETIDPHTGLRFDTCFKTGCLDLLFGIYQKRDTRASMVEQIEVT